MRFRARLVRLGVLAVLLVMIGLRPLTAVAAVEPDPDDGPPPALQMEQCLAFGTVTLYPDGRFCWCVWQVPNSIRFRSDVQPNIGSPKAKITIWRWDASGNNETLVFSAKRTGLHAIDETFSGPAYYGMCAKYPLGQLVDGSAFDFMWVSSIVD
jgi:hypothetical protein